MFSVVCALFAVGLERKGGRAGGKQLHPSLPATTNTAPRADYFLVIAWLIQPQALDVHGNYSSQCSEKPFFWGGSYDIWKYILYHRCSMMGPKSGISGNDFLKPSYTLYFSPNRLHWWQWQSMNFCIFSGMLSFAKNGRTDNFRAAAQELTRQTEALLGCAIHATAQYQQHVVAA